MLKQAEEHEAGRYYFLLGSLVFSAFTLEAFLNHIGENKVTIWEAIERKLGVRDKLTVVLDTVAIKPNFGEMPWQIFKVMVQYRNRTAH